MARYNLVTIRPQGFLHASAFQEVKDSLAWSLTALGHEVVSTENAWAATGTNVIFGAELLSPASTIPDNSILFNMEQPSHPRMKHIQRLAQTHPVWDIYRANVEAFKNQGFDAHYLPIGYTPNLTRGKPRSDAHNNKDKDIDVLFLGWMTARRTKIIQALKNAGLTVYASDNCYGGARDQLLARSKICLNIHHDGRDLFEIVRVSYYLANGKCVVSELPSDLADHLDIRPAIYFCDYDSIVTHCQALLNNEMAIHEWEEAAWGFRERDFTRAVRQVLSGPSTTPILDRYNKGCETGDMRDFLPLLRGLAKGQILEIGVRDGASTSAFLLGLEDRDPSGSLLSIDITDCSQLWTHPQWTFQCTDSKTLSYAENTFDLILVDGDHSPTGFLTDLKNALRWVKPGGLVLCHDISPLPNYTNEARGGDWPSQYVGEYFFQHSKEHHLRHFIYPGAWGMGVIQKDL